MLQAVFDWTDSHLHRFVLDEEAWGGGEKYLCPYDVEDGEADGVPESDVRLDEVLDAPGDLLSYLYDYGDDWHHLLIVEHVGPAVEDVRLLAGHGAAPPEDSGGPWDWDADAAPPFDLAETQAALAVWRVTRSLPPALLMQQQQLCATPSEATLLELFDTAGLDRSIAVDDDLAETATARYRWLLGRIGTGVKLTAAGWLPPLVTEAMDALWPEDRWIGKRNREDLTEPVRRLRASAQRSGLLRGLTRATATDDDRYGAARGPARDVPAPGRAIGWRAA